MELDVLNFSNLGGVLDESDKEESKFEKYGAYHKTNVVFILDLTSDMLIPSCFRESNGKPVSAAFGCVLAIRQSVIDMIKHSSLGGGGRDRIALVGLLHKRCVILLDMQLPSADTLKVIDKLMQSLRGASVKEGKKIDLQKALDTSFTLLKDLSGDGQIFICTTNDDPCDRTVRKGMSEEIAVCSKATDLAQNHNISIKLLAVPREGYPAFDMVRFWRTIVADRGADDHPVFESLHDVASHVRSLIRPTALAVPNGSNVKLRVKNSLKKHEDGGHILEVHVNLYNLSRSRNLSPGKSFYIDVDDRKFLAEARVRDGHSMTSYSDMYEANVAHEGKTDSTTDDENMLEHERNQGHEIYQRKKVLKFRERDMKVWTAEELAVLVKNNTSKTVDIIGFITESKINTEFRGQSPQYMTLSKGSNNDEQCSWWCALWRTCVTLKVACVAVLLLRKTSSPKQVLLFAHGAHLDAYGCLRLPRGFYVHHIPFADRVYTEICPRSLKSVSHNQSLTENEQNINTKLLSSLRRSLDSVSAQFFSPVGDVGAERQWKVLEALALDQAAPQQNEPPVSYPHEIANEVDIIRALCAQSIISKKKRKETDSQQEKPVKRKGGAKRADIN